VIALEPDDYYRLATQRITPRKAREAATIDGDDGAATAVLNAIGESIRF
jgi:hypothetical protein